MSNIFIITEETKKLFNCTSSLEDKGHCCLFSHGSDNLIFTQIQEFMPDIIIIDTKFPQAELITRKVKADFKGFNIQVLLVIGAFDEPNYLDQVDGFVLEPIRENILEGTINSHLKIKNSLDELDKNNKEISKNLYSLNALYNTSSQLAGTLNREKLCKIMLEGLEKTLNFDVATLLVFNKDKFADIYINSLHQPTESLKDALQLRLLLEYKNLYTNDSLPYEIELKNVNLIQNTGNSTQIYDLKVFNFDKLTSEIKVGDDFFGIVEIYRQRPFTKEDKTCFQTITNQIPLPLRSAKLYEEIIEKNAMLEKLEKIKSEFVSIVSHELRTPLTPINNSLEIVLSGEAGEISKDAENFIKMAKRNMLRLSDIIEDLLDLSRVQTGKMDVDFKKCEILPSLELVKETFTKSAETAGIELVFNFEEELPKLYADSRRIEQVLSNLISNALKFTPKGGKIEVSVTNTNSKEINKDNLIMPKTKIIGDYIKISVKDTGVGIEKENIAKIFDKFSQIENTLSRKVGGIGLGLSISKHLIDSHFGAIEVVSEKDKGADFCVYLPIMSDVLKFEIDTTRHLQEAKKYCLNYFKEVKDSGFYEEITNLGFIKNTKQTMNLTIEDNKHIHRWFFTPEIDKNVTIFTQKAIKNELESNFSKWEKCDIVFKKADFEDSKDDFGKIFNLINKIWEYKIG